MRNEKLLKILIIQDEDAQLYMEFGQPVVLAIKFEIMTEFFSDIKYFKGINNGV